MLAMIEHPNGLPKQIEAGPAASLSGDKIRYGSLDTLGGSSGSGILDATTGMLVGVHINGGCTSTGGTNSGVRISSILAQSDVMKRLSECGEQTLLSDEFENGIGTWTVSGLWHTVTGPSCSDAASGDSAMYYGLDATCSYNTGQPTAGSLTSAAIDGIDESSILRCNYK